MPTGGVLDSDYSNWSESYSCTFSSTNTYIVGDSSGKIYYYNANYGYNTTVNPSGSSNWGTIITGLAFAPNASVFAAALSANKQKVTTTVAGSNSASAWWGWNSSPPDYLCVDYSPDGMLLAEGDSASLQIYDTTPGNGNAYNQIFSDSTLGKINSVDFSFDNCWLAAGSDNSNVYLYSANCRKNQTASFSAIRCPIDYFLNSSNKCQSCSSLVGCRKCSSASACLICTDQYYINGSSCALCTSINSACV